MIYKKQVSIDSLLRVHERHEITCPLINPLQFEGHCATRIYKVDIDYNPKDLTVNLKELNSAIDDLDKWTSGVINVYNNLEDRSKIQIDVSLIIDLLETSHKDELKEQASEINGLIEEWLSYREDYKEASKEKKEIERIHICNTEKEILKLKVSKKDTSEQEELLEFYKNEIIEQDEKIEQAINFFERYVQDDFSEKVVNFSNFLEVVRERNDNLRELVADLKIEIVNNYKEELEIYQPDEYLDRLYPPTENILNIGVLSNNTELYHRDEPANFRTLIQGLKSKGVIDFNQMGDLIDISSEDREHRKKILLDTLKSNGIKKVRYYDTHHEYKEDRTNFKEELLIKPKLNYRHI